MDAAFVNGNWIKNTKFCDFLSDALFFYVHDQPLVILLDIRI